MTLFSCTVFCSLVLGAARALAPAQATIANAGLRASAGSAAKHPTARAEVQQVLAESTVERQFIRSLAPYLRASGATDAAVLRRLPPWVAGMRPAFRVGDDLVVLATASAPSQVAVTLPPGHWVNFWTGAQALGGSAFMAEIPARYLAVWVRGGSVILRHISPRYRQEECGMQQPNDYPEDCHPTCLLDVMPPYSSSRSPLTDAQGRSIRRSNTSLELQGKAARVTVRWRFTPVASVRVNGHPVLVQASPEGYYATFEHGGRSTIAWTIGGYMTSAMESTSGRSTRQNQMQ